MANNNEQNAQPEIVFAAAPPPSAAETIATTRARDHYPLERVKASDPMSPMLDFVMSDGFGRKLFGRDEPLQKCDQRGR